MIKVLAFVYICAGAGQAQFCHLDVIVETTAQGCLDAKNIAEAEESTVDRRATKVYCLPMMFIDMDFTP